MVDQIPFFSICIPQYNRTNFLIAALESIKKQSFLDFEICISDGNSTDGGSEKIVKYLENSQLAYTFYKSNINLPYDQNLRKSISLSKGRYLILLGNDDGLINDSVLDYLHGLLISHKNVKVAISNYYELSTNKTYFRIPENEYNPNGDQAIISCFRNFSFLSGIILDGEESRLSETNLCDGSEMYQMYLGSKLLTNGGAYLGINKVLIIKDIQIPNEKVNSYKTDFKSNKPFKIIYLPMRKIPHTIFQGLNIENARLVKIAVTKIAIQLYLFTFPYWIQEYKRTQTFRYSLGVYLGVRPNIVLNNVPSSILHRLFCWSIYICFGFVGFLMPNLFYVRVLPLFYRIAKNIKFS